MHEEEGDVEALRRRLYRPGASTADVDSYVDASGVAEADDDEGATAEPAPRIRRRAAVAATGVAVIALLGGALGSGALSPSPAPTPSSTVTVDTGTGAMEVAVPVVEDRGQRRYASGAASEAGPQRFIYTVARGDTLIGIASRFDLCTGDVLVSLPYGFDQSTLPPGKQLLLRRYSTSPPQYDASGAC